MHTLAATKFKLPLGLPQTLLQTLLRLRAATAQPVLQDRQRRRREEEVARIEIRPLYLLHALSTPDRDVSQFAHGRKKKNRPALFPFQPLSSILHA